MCTYAGSSFEELTKAIASSQDLQSLVMKKG